MNEFARIAWRAAVIAAITMTAGFGCGDSTKREVVVYTALDRAFSAPIFAEFERATGIRVRATYDPESTKTIGLVNRIRAEKERPRCDVFWNNEIINTLNLKREGLLAPSTPAGAEGIPPQYRDSAGYWYGFAARARVLIVNREMVPNEDEPRSVRDLLDPRWRGKIAVAKPLFGTTASHVAVLFSLWGEAEATAFLDALKANEVQIHGGNKGCAIAVAEGRAAIGLTDTDDALIELERGRPVRIVYPDQGENEPGTLFLPNTLAMVAGAPHPDEALRFIEFLLSAETERRLAAGPSAQIPLREGLKPSPRVRGPDSVRAMQVDLDTAAESFDAASRVVEERFLR